MTLQILWCARCRTGFTFTDARVERYFTVVLDAANFASLQDI
jgi:hypothetical protein